MLYLVLRDRYRQAVWLNSGVEQRKDCKRSGECFWSAQIRISRHDRGWLLTTGVDALGSREARSGQGTQRGDKDHCRDRVQKVQQRKDPQAAGRRPREIDAVDE